MELKDDRINFDDPAQRGLVMNAIRGMRGIYRISMVKWRTRRTDAQNRYYFGVVLREIREYLNDQGDTYSVLQIHDMLKEKFIEPTPVVNRDGEVIGHTRESKTLDVEQFMRFIDNVVKFAAEMGIVVPDASNYYDRTTGKAA